VWTRTKSYPESNSADFGAHEDFEVFVIGEDRDGVLGAFEVMTPMTESENNSQHFAIVDIIVAFSWV